MQKKHLDFLNGHFWKYAKTMPKWPHWYINRKLIRGQESHDLFCDIVELIRSEGSEERFYSRTLKYLYVGDWKLWTMGGEIIRDEETYLANCHRPIENILNIAHIHGLPPSLVDPNDGIGLVREFR